MKWEFVDTSTPIKKNEAPDNGRFVVVILVIAILSVLVVSFMACNSCNTPVTHTTVTTDTTWHAAAPVTLINKPEPKEIIPPAKNTVPPIPKPSKNYDSLAKQYAALSARLEAVEKAHYPVKVYSDTARQDSSKVVISDTVSQNALTGRGVTFMLKYPVIKETINNTVVIPPRRQFYFNLGAGAVQQKEYYGVSGVIGLSYKTKKDVMFTVDYSANTLQYHEILFIRQGKISFR